MSYKATAEKISQYRRQIADLREKMRSAQASIEPEQVKDYEFRRAGGGVRLSELSATRTRCSSCTIWEPRVRTAHCGRTASTACSTICAAARPSVVASPDTPEQQQKFAQGRGWRFPMVSCQGNTFAQDMGYWRDDQAMPGVSVFKRQGGKLVRVADTSFSPGDDFCGVWHFLDLIPEGAAGWQPKYSYAD